MCHTPAVPLRQIGAMRAVVPAKREGSFELILGSNPVPAPAGETACDAYLVMVNSSPGAGPDWILVRPSSDGRGARGLLLPGLS